MPALTIAAIVFIAGLALCIAIATWLHRRSLTPGQQIAALEARNLRQRQQLAPPKVLPAFDTRHTVLDVPHRAQLSAHINSGGNVVQFNQAAHIERVEQRIRVTAQAAAWDDNYNGSQTRCPYARDLKAAALWAEAYRAEWLRILQIREERGPAVTRVRPPNETTLCSVAT